MHFDIKNIQDASEYMYVYFVLYNPKLVRII